MNENASLRSMFVDLMIKTVPNYANRIFYSLGFLSMISFVILMVTGTLMVLNGPNWWLTSSLGVYTRSVHLWATQAFVLFIILHLMIVFFTSGFRGKRKLTWVVGVLMFMFVLTEAEFGYVLRGDFSSQWRSLQGADFYNGAALGHWVNSLNYMQIYGIHVVAVPLVLLGLVFCHYLFVKVRGIAKPYRPDVKYEMVPANHILLFVRGGVLTALLLGLAVVFPSPFLKPTTVKEVASDDPVLVAKALVTEWDKSSDTATYKDNIDPYTFDTQAVYITGPYQQYVQSSGAKDWLAVYNKEPQDTQAAQLKALSDYYEADTTPDSLFADAKKPAQLNPANQVVLALLKMAQAGLYEPALNAANASGDNTTYASRFMADTGVMDDRAQELGITTDQYGMLREESSKFPVGAWWLYPIGLLNHTVLAKDEDNGDRDGAAILGLSLLLLLAYPYIPILNRIPDWLKVYKLIWWHRKDKTPAAPATTE